MTALRPFFLLLGRASVFWIGTFTLAWITIVVVGLAEAEEAFVAANFDAALIATLVFPGAAGWLFGLVIQEFEHTTFAVHLPGVRRRVATGFLASGVGVTLASVVVAWNLAPSTLGMPLMLALGFGAYCAAGVLQDPLSNWITTVNVVVVLLVVARSRDLANVAADHPWIAAGLALGAGAAGCWRLFSLATFRRKPFRATKPIPGRFSFQRGHEYERRLRSGDRSRTTGWRGGYLGRRPWAWVRAAHHEVHGALGWKAAVKTLGKMWGLGLIVLVSAWIDKGDLSYPKAVAYSLFDALLRSPHVAPFGKEGGPHAMVFIVIAAAGVVTAMFKPIALSDALLYPLSRAQRAAVAFRGALADAGILLAVLGAGLFAIGHAAGLWLGFEPRFDFMPFYFRVLLVTLILMPLGYWGRSLLSVASRRKAENTIVGIIFGMIGFILLVGIAIWFLPLIFPSPLPELGFLLVALVLSQTIYRTKVRAYYRTADLA